MTRDEAFALDAFLQAYQKDLALGEVHASAKYEALFPDHRLAIAREYALIEHGEGLDDTKIQNPPSTQLPLSGRRIASFRLIRELGRGGQATVYEAEDERLGRKVALKVLRSAFLSNDKMSARFRREAAVTSQLDHAAICPVFEAGEDEGIEFIAMRLIEGETLADRIASVLSERDALLSLTDTRELQNASSGTRPRQSLEDLLTFFETTARALHLAHEHGLVHRDVKPGNIMVTPTGKPVLLDFGLAYYEQDELTNLTGSGEQMGTPFYMPPEQIDASFGTVDRRSDVYALGATMYECATGSHPFEGTSRTQLYQKILTGELREPRAVQPAVPRELSVVLMTALDRNQNRRYASAEAFADDLARVRAREPIHARPTPIPLRLGRWIQRNPSVSTFLLLMTLGLGITFFLMGELSVKLTETRALALAAAADDSSDSTLSLLLAREAFRTAETPQTLSSLHRAVAGFRPVIELRGHRGPIVNAERSPDNTLYLTASTDGDVKIWDRQGQVTKTVRHETRVASATFSPDSDEIVSGSTDGTVAFWGTRDDRYEQLADMGAEVLPIEFSPNGRRLLTASRRGEILIWRRQSPRQTDDAQEKYPSYTTVAQVLHPSGLRSARFSPNSQRILYATDDGIARIWTPETGKMVDLSAPMPQHETQTPIEDAVFSPDGGLILTHTEFTVRLWDDEGNLLQDLEHDISGIVKIAFTPDHRILTTTSTRATVWHEDDDGEFVPVYRVPAREGAFTDATFIFHQNSLASRICFSMQGGSASVYYPVDEQLIPSMLVRMHELDFRTRQLTDPSRERAQHEYLTWSADGTAKVWDIDAPHRGFARRMVFPVDQIAFGPHPHGFTGGTTTIAGLYPGHSTLLSQGEQIGDPLFRNKVPISERFLGTSPQHDRVITTASDHTIHIWNKDTDRLHTLVGHRHEVEDAQFSPDQSMLASLSRDSQNAEIFVWKLSSDQIMTETKLSGAALAWHPEGQVIATGTASGHVRLWDLQGKVVAVPQLAGSAVGTVRFGPKGNQLYAGCDDGSLLIFDLSTRDREPSRIVCHSGKISALEVSPDGQYVASCSGDGTARLARLDGSEICTLRGHRGPVNSLAFDAHSDRLATCGSDGFIYFWTLDPGILLRIADAEQIRGFTASERIEYGDLIVQ